MEKGGPKLKMFTSVFGPFDEQCTRYEMCRKTTDLLHISRRRTSTQETARPCTTVIIFFDSHVFPKLS